MDTNKKTTMPFVSNSLMEWGYINNNHIDKCIITTGYFLLKRVSSAIKTDFNVELTSWVKECSIRKSWLN